ncbi:uncharacterized protein LOC116256677 [Nymphaea colorata]|uniref:uncharacterized protein LOC116256677 n=1 Tax=Nymphaea colorata TaxID=210225 RepID=UPI00129D95D2|nr:uncharacterized protein LOC116256677 [Nymphaea colorata]XP_031488947.1 uncharacterized protein LOC116256677 [Nymphaea colorata]
MFLCPVKMILAPCSGFDLLLKHQDASVKCKIGKYSCALVNHLSDKKFFATVANETFGCIKKPRNFSIHSSVDDNVVSTGQSSKASIADSGSSSKRDLIASEPLSSTMLNSQITDVNVDEATASLKDPDAGLQTDSLQEGNEKISSTEQISRKPSMTAREKLRAARVLSRFRDTPESSKQDMGMKVLDALRDSDKGKSRSGLPQAPTNLFDDSKRGLPKQGLTFDFPGGSDLLFIIFSFVFISSVMFATTYIVWKAGAIHFNEY